MMMMMMVVLMLVVVMMMVRGGVGGRVGVGAGTGGEDSRGEGGPNGGSWWGGVETVGGWRTRRETGI